MTRFMIAVTASLLRHARPRSRWPSSASPWRRTGLVATGDGPGCRLCSLAGRRAVADDPRRGHHRRRRSDAQRRRANGDAERRQHRRPAGPGRLALPLFRNQPGAATSTAARRAGMRLDIAAGTAVRFEPGQSREVTLVPYARRAQGVRLQPEGRWEGWTDASHAFPAPPMPPCSARPPATGCASPTPNCSSRSSRISPPTARR